MFFAAVNVVCLEALRDEAQRLREWWTVEPLATWAAIHLGPGKLPCHLQSLPSMPWSVRKDTPLKLSLRFLGSGK